MKDYRKIAEDIVKNNFSLSIEEYSETDIFRIKDNIYKCLRYDVIKEATLAALRDSYPDISTNKSDEDLEIICDVVAEDYVFNEEYNESFSEIDNIYNMIDSHLDLLEEQEQIR